MNEEERKAIEFFYNLRATINESNMLFNEEINVKHGKETIKQITIILNLIEKLQKENEELLEVKVSASAHNRMLELEKEKSKYEWIRQNCLPQELVNKLYIPIQKIKDKIEELKNNPLKIKQNGKYYYETHAYNKIIIGVLQELIEEREEK